MMDELRWRHCKVCDERLKCDNFPYKRGQTNVVKTTLTTKGICFMCESATSKADEKHKTCIHCKETKPLHEFSGNKKKGNECLTCLSSTKICTGCGQEKRLTQFYRTYSKAYLGRLDRCKQCQAMKSKVVNECRSYADSLYEYLKGRFDQGGYVTYSPEMLDAAYIKSIWWIDNKPQTIISQYFKGDVLLPLMHLLDDFKSKTKHCSKCKETLLTTAFSKNVKFISGLNNYCKKCMKSYKVTKNKLDDSATDANLKSTEGHNNMRDLL